MNQFHVFLACLGQFMHGEAANLHPALKSTIINAPTYSAERKCVAVQLSEPLENMSAKADLQAWYPHASGQEARQQLLRRVSSDSSSLLIHLAMALTILVALYQETDYDFGLSLAGLPIIDFGVAWGEAPVTPENTIKYFHAGEEPFGMQDPKKHAWMWFRNALGQLATLDVCMYSFQCFLRVGTAGFWTPTVTFPPYVPAVWIENSGLEQFYVLRNSLSVLRDPRAVEAADLVRKLLDRGNWTKEQVEDLVNKLAVQVGRYATDLTNGEQQQAAHIQNLVRWTCMSSMQLRAVLLNSTWKNWPTEWDGVIDEP